MQRIFAEKGKSFGSIRAFTKKLRKIHFPNVSAPIPGFVETFMGRTARPSRLKGKVSELIHRFMAGAAADPVAPDRARGDILYSMDARANLSESLADVAARCFVRLVLQFGSTLSGRVHERSDLDLAVLLRNPKFTFAEFSGLHAQLQLLFPEKEIDLVILNHADPLLLKKITEHCRLLFGEPAVLQRLKIYSFRRYQDHRRFLEIEKRFAERFIQEVNAGK